MSAPRPGHLSRWARAFVLVPLFAWPARAAPEDRAFAWTPSPGVPAVTHAWTTGMGMQVLCLEADPQAGFWAGTESDGLWRFDPGAARDDAWRRFTVADGLGEDHVTALLADASGRIWAGHGSRGVSVFDGKTWRAYGPVEGPLGFRIHDLAEDAGGRIWMASDLGISVYSDPAGRWFHVTTRNGLPENGVQSIAFDRAGRAVLGMQCEGVVVGEWGEQGGFRMVLHQRGPDRMPITPRGDGLPSGLINTLLAARDGTLYAGTTAGLALSRDGGASWSHWRGGNLWAKILGRYVASGDRERLPAGEKFLHYLPDEAARSPAEREAIQRARDAARGAMEAPLLADDWVSALAEDAEGRLWVGFRQMGVQVFDPPDMTVHHVSSSNTPADVRAILPGLGTGPLLACYNDGLRMVPFASPGPARTLRVHPIPASFPAAAAPPTAAELEELAAAIPGREVALGTGDAVYLGSDLQTRGDWVGKYGRQNAEIHGHAFSLRSLAHKTTSRSPYEVEYDAGPNGLKLSRYTWLPAYSEVHPGALYNTYMGSRMLGEINDGSFSGWSFEHDGPDLWVKVGIHAQGLHRVSLYFCNGDAHSKKNGLRDFVVEARHAPSGDPARLREAPVTARARVRDFYDGVYERFLVSGGETNCFRIARNHSFVAKVHGVFVDKLSGPVVPHETTPRLHGLADVYWGPTDPELLNPDASRDPALLRAARRLWSLLGDPATLTKAAAWEKEARLLAYRAAVAAGAEPEWLRAWRWQSGLWDDSDRAGFRTAMRMGWQNYDVRNNVQKEIKHRIWDEQGSRAP